MTDGIPHLFEALKSMLEDMHGLAVEGQRRDNAPDMQCVLISQMRMAIAAVDGKMGQMRERLGDAHD